MAEASGFTPEWIAAQRWFRSKGRPLAAVSEVDRAPLGVDAALTVLAVEYADGGEGHRYLAPAVDGREPRDGEGAWAALADAIARDALLAGARGRFRGTRAAGAMDGLLSAGAGERRLGVEQSNTSVLVGERLMLKLYRLLEEGANPEVEMSAFLTDAGFADTPALAGAMTYEADGAAFAAAMLQAFVPSTGDAWAVLLRALSDDAAGALDLVRRIGDLTARMHAALASHPEHPAFPARPATVAETAAWRASAERQLAQAVTAVSGAAHDRLVALAPRVTARLADTFGSATGEARASRIHGDYHLGQLLARPDGGFSVIDLEGEPARPLVERRAPGSPLRDVAGMLRSLDYAARTVQDTAAARFDGEGWLSEARAAFLDGYGGIASVDRPLLDAFELEKACYEIRYEANNRPEWLWLPIA
ncbi:MAG: phosphotransferase, partial [Chloroflexi bacterium]|nr:phosphotransferase [Chloroflexota bacterium]